MKISSWVASLFYFVILARTETRLFIGEWQKKLKTTYDKGLLKTKGKYWYMRKGEWEIKLEVLPGPKLVWSKLCRETYNLC